MNYYPFGIESTFINQVTTLYCIHTMTSDSSDDDSIPDFPKQPEGRSTLRRRVPEQCPWGGPTEGADHDEGFLRRKEPRELHEDFS